MKVLVTGGSGLIGQHCIRGFLQAGHEVTGLFSRSKPALEGCQWLQVDLLDEAQRNAVVDEVRPEVLVHLAWQVGDVDGGIQLDWLAASLCLIRQFQKQGGAFLFTAGTSMEYAWNGQLCMEDDALFDSSTLYGHAKHALWKTVSQFCLRSGLPHCHGRIFFLCGIGQEPTRFVPAVIHSLLENQPFVCKSGHLYRDYLDVEEVSAIVNALVNQRVEGAYNIASGVGTKVGDIASEIMSQLGKPGLVEFSPAPPSDPPDLRVVASTEKLSKVLGYKPEFDLKHTIQKTIHWIQSTPSS
ncbi:MAG: NAD(P)-dependent oxidoreductase [Verrucomicrobiae bacterium]|nr:NAD(P)-dependent oxidoreductase [Verrucomicrobiae bacterium]